MPKFTITYEAPAEITTDTGWTYAATARPMYGLHDYERYITFVRELKDYELKKLSDTIHLLNNPGYCNWSARLFSTAPGLAKYKFTSTCDSSD